MKEIGGYFGFEDLVHKEFHSGMIALNTGRNALCYALFGTILSVLFLGESFHLFHLSGMALIFSGIYLATRG